MLKRLKDGEEIGVVSDAIAAVLKSKFDAHNLKAPISIGLAIDLVATMACRVIADVLEDQKACATQYRGIYQRAQKYEKGSMVSHQGSLFIALTDVPALAAPGSTEAWQLAVKNGHGG